MIAPRPAPRLALRPLLLLAVAAAVAILPVAGNGYLRGLVVLSGSYVVAVAGLALLAGHAGQLSLGQGAFFALGAYAYGVLGVRAGWPPLLALPVAVAGVALLAWAVGDLLLRLRGHFLSLGTLAFASIVLVGLRELGPLTGGPSGLGGIPRLLPGPPPFLARDALAGWTAWAVAGLVLLGFERLVRSEVGVALRALSSTETGAAAIGLDAHRLKRAVFVLAAAAAALGGVLYADYLTFISPAAFEVLLGVQLVVMVVVGGTASFWGPLLGAVGITALAEVLRGVIPLAVPGARGPVELAGLSAVLGLAVVLLPRGLAGGGWALTRHAGTAEPGQ